MASQSYTIEIETIGMHKFSSLMNFNVVPNLDTSINLLPQVHDISIYESIGSSVIRAELAIIDMVGLFTNFPLSGEEVIVVTYRNVADNTTNQLFFVIDSVSHINIGDGNKSLGYVIRCVSIEAFANSLQRVQQAYEGTTSKIVQDVFDDHITDRIKRFFPSFKPKNIIIEDNPTEPHTVVFPNLSPFASIDMLAKTEISMHPDRYSYMFYQTPTEFKFTTLQGLTQNKEAIAFAKANKYKFLSDEISEKHSDMKNDERLVSNLVVNKRHASLQKILGGYYHNNLFDINIAQKAVYSRDTKIDDVVTMLPHKLNTRNYIDAIGGFNREGIEESNRTRYVLSNRKEYDNNYPIKKMRERWGQDLVSKTAMSQIDFTVTIPGTNRFKAGSLFYLEFPEVHGFSDVEADDLVSGLFLVSEIKHLITINGTQTTVLRLSKDSYENSIDRRSKYV